MAAVEAPRDHEADDDKMNILQLNLERERTIKRLKDQDSKSNAAQIADLLAVYEFYITFYLFIVLVVFVSYFLALDWITGS